METTATTATTLKIQFDLHTRLFNNVVEGISNDESNDRASETVNHIKWLAGHLFSARMGLHQLGGLEKFDQWDEFFAHGKAIDPSLNYPELSEIVNKWNEVSERISTGLGQLPETMLDSEAPVRVPVPDSSMRSFLGFMMHHEAYHIGQMGILRKYLGKEAMKYN